MECNKDEATRAKEIAEKKFSMKDVVGAKKFALKAQTLYPNLDGIPHMLATFDVYISAENKIHGESDWYGILGVSPQADDETVRKQYRKLALVLHPDKNKSIGGEGAFKLISEAWSLLSDKAKRAAYDQKTNAKVFQKPSTPSGVSSTPTGTNGFHNFTKNTTSNSRPPKSTYSNARTTKSTPRANHSSSPASSYKPKPNTFWTVCHQCKMQYEYLRVYLNHNLLCPNCHEPFFAVETAPPSVNAAKSSTPWSFSQQRQTSDHHTGKNAANSRRNEGSPNVGVGGFNQANYRWVPFSETAGASAVAQAATVVQQAYEKVKREREEAQAAKKREEALQRKHPTSKKVTGVSSTGNAAKRRRGLEDFTNQVSVGVGSKQFNFETSRVNGIIKPNSTRDMSQHELQILLTAKAKTNICEKLEEWNSVTTSKSATKEELNRNERVYREGEKSFASNDLQDRNKCGESLDKKNEMHGIESFPAPSRANILETLSINVPDPDFHDFDKDRIEMCFRDNQVWAAYDGDDGMPRYYAMIHNVISLNPFKMRISWLNSKTNNELGPLNWVASGFSKTCGDFRVGKYEIYNSLNSFSHKVRWAKGARGVICIYPRKGDVWALYRNWSPDWNELTTDEVIHKYDMVEVLEDYKEDLGVTIAPLVKVAGFKTVFHRHLDPREIRTIPREEMFRFSHHVPSYLLTGQEAPSAPKGCRELDPAAIPLELLHVLSTAKEEVNLEDEEKVKDANVVADLAADNEVIENCPKAGEEEKGNFIEIHGVEILKGM
ncbi:DnaJ domain-containing protein/DUF3444 domain-containing protein [Cephalotus follicularis]|uniref:DnaJ domain-containing protein/DUF3444 domain-containing protein n=1 Tax=Cephalotus follicularis TaxID=3775 RepID=A0A1Q3C063_CEPFO|nr:DnaJ domain-containing protein/DUF3444 domain-containing protein [Cephalotus follicularis]